MSAPVGGEAWWFIPRLAFNAAAYDLDQPLSDGRSRLKRVIPTFSVDTGWVFERDTRLWDAEAGQSAPLRSKEEANDYRYFPDPDLPPLVVDGSVMASVLRALPELPAARFERYQKTHGISADDARTTVDLGDRYAIEPAFVEFSRESYATTRPQVAEGFSYASDTNDEWLSGEGLLALLDDGQPERRRRATD